MKTALTIAGSDSSGGAGIQADLKTFSALGVYGMSAITAVTAQNTIGVRSIANIPVNIVKDQIEAVYEDIEVHGVKIGMLSNSEIIKTVASTLKLVGAKNIVLDPVMVSKSGHHLLEKEAVEALKTQLLPLADIITPNIPEAESLLNREIATEVHMREACEELADFGPRAILLKGGHLSGDPIDVLYMNGEIHLLHQKRIETKNTHGTGCTLSSAIAAYLALDNPLVEAVKQGKSYITGAIENSLNIGRGHGPTHHFHNLY